MKKVITVFFLLLIITVSNGQEMDTTLRMSIQVGTGWTHYYNNLVIGHNNVKNDYLGSSLRIMWEPEHRLSIGVETGYYKLYQVTLDTGDGNVDLAVIPVMANIRMRIFKDFYVTGGTGIVIMNSDVSSTSRKSDKTRVMSYSNVQLSGLYLFHLSQQLAVGGEMKLMWIDKTNDFVHSLQGIVSWRF